MKCPHCQSTLVENISLGVSKKDEAIQKDSKIKEDQGLRKHEDQIPGGLADKNQPRDFPPDQITMGIKVELEHTNDANLAREIAMDHLKEDPEYYTKLTDMEAGELDKSIEESKVNEWKSFKDMDDKELKHYVRKQDLLSAVQGSKFSDKDFDFLNKAKFELFNRGYKDISTVPDYEERNRNIDSEKQTGVKDHRKENESKVVEDKVNESDLSKLDDNELVAKYEEVKAKIDWSKETGQGEVWGSELYKELSSIAKEFKKRALEIGESKVKEAEKVSREDMVSAVIKYVKSAELKEIGEILDKCSEFNLEKIYAFVQSKPVKSEVKEAEDSDTMQIVAKGIVDKITADKLAVDSKGMVVADEDDKNKFMIIRKKE